MLIEPLHLAANKSESIIESTGRWWSASSDSNHSIQQTRSSDQKSQPVHWADETNGSKVNQTAQTSHSQGKETANDNNNNNNGHNKRTARRKRKREKEKKEKKRIKKNKKEQEREKVGGPPVVIPFETRISRIKQVATQRREKRQPALAMIHTTLTHGRTYPVYS